MARPAGALTAKQQQGVRSREEILDVAERLMGSHGYAGTSVSMLAKESGLPASSIYWHFGSKSGVLGAVMERGATRFFTSITPTQLDGSAEPRDRVENLMGLSLTAIKEHPEFLRLFIFLLLGAEGDHDQQAVVDRVRAEGARLLCRGLEYAYTPWGDELAEQIGREVGPVALALFDGMFIASEAGDLPPGLIDNVIEALDLVATAIRLR